MIGIISALGVTFASETSNKRVGHVRPVYGTLEAVGTLTDLRMAVPDLTNSLFCYVVGEVTEGAVGSAFWWILKRM